MSYYLRKYNCEDCGEYTERKRSLKNAMVCFDCGLKRAVTAALELHSHSGGRYDRWQSGNGPKGRPRNQ